MIWKPNVTVAAVVEQDGKFLLVEEQTRGGILFNQPAGHLEPTESIIQHSHADNITFLRFAFAGSVSDHDPGRTLDAGIVRAAWFSLDEIRETAYRHRSPLVMKCVEDHLAGKYYPLEILTHYD